MGRSKKKSIGRGNLLKADGNGERKEKDFYTVARGKRGGEDANRKTFIAISKRKRKGRKARSRARTTSYGGGLG